MNRCLLCGQDQCASLIDFGPQPICHHFFDGSQPETRHPFRLGQCQACGLAQLLDPVPSRLLTPRFDWITYNEPEAHLDALVDILRGLPGITPQSGICGVSFKENSTRERLAKLGFHNSWQIDFQEDLGIADPRAGVEVAHERIRPGLEQRLHAKHGAPDMVLVRHILENTRDPLGFLEALRRLVKPGGYIVFDSPDSARGFDLCDYTMLWEDHTFYFVESTFQMCLQRGGFTLARFEQYRSPHENCLVAIAQPVAVPGPASLSPASLEQEKDRLARFAKGWEPRRQAMRKLFQEWRQRGKIALFGAGHRAVMFVNLLGLADLIDFVVDDHPRKRGLRLPGSRLPIVGSDVLAGNEVKLCLSSLGPDSEAKVVQKFSQFVAQGGTFASIYHTRPGSLLNFIAGSGATL
jgi:SAM-dependent methyltransferase